MSRIGVSNSWNAVVRHLNQKFLSFAELVVDQMPIGQS